VSNHSSMHRGGYSGVHSPDIGRLLGQNGELSTLSKNRRRMLLVRAAPARLAPQPQTSEELRLLVINNFSVPPHVFSHYYHSLVS
jgi:hypothetical protein